MPSAQLRRRLPRSSAAAIGRVIPPVAGLVLWLALGCTSTPETLRQTLDAIGKEDLKGIVDELPPKARPAILAKPYYVIDEYEEFRGDTAIMFQARATLVFFYLDPSLGLCQVRKYRYRTSARIWDRYDVVLRHIPPKYTGTGEQEIGTIGGSGTGKR